MHFFEPLFAGLKDHAPALLGTLAIWIATLVVSAWIARLYLVAIPPDHFSRRHDPFANAHGPHFLLHWALLVFKNLIGLAMSVAGFFMLVTPGPGIIVLLLGLYLVDLPVKRRLERKLLARPKILRMVNRLREKANQPALELSE